MRSGFWKGFKDGFARASLYGVGPVVAFIIGLYLGSASHPYEVCKKQYDTPEDIAECTWIRMNP